MDFFDLHLCKVILHQVIIESRNIDKNRNHINYIK